VFRGGVVRRRVAGLLTALGLSVAWLSGEPAQAEGGIRTFLMGDSFAVGMAPLFGADHTVAMIGGSVHYRWESVPNIDRGTRVVLVLGTNDSVEIGPEGVANYGYRVREIARKLADRAHDVVWVGPPCILPGHMYIDDEHLRDMAEVQREAVVELGRANLRWVSMRAMTQRDGICLEDDRTEDQVHFTAAGYARVVREIRKAAGMPAR
jgi:GDSL-like Lipase/Acylhydrolase family